MTKHVRVVAEPHDPVVLHRLLRVLIAQAELELRQQHLKEGPVEPPATEEQAS